MFFASCAPPAPPPAPKLAFDSTSFDYGTVEQGMPVTHTFRFRNAGGSDLTINNLKAAAEVKASASAHVIPPGGQAAIVVTLATDRTVRRRDRTVTVYSNDPAQPVATLALSGTVTVEVAADPPALYLGRVPRGTRATSEARIVTGAPRHLRVTDEGNRVVRASLEGDVPTLAVAIRPDAPLGRFRETVAIKTDSAKYPTLRIPVVGVVEAAKD